MDRRVWLLVGCLVLAGCMATGPGADGSPNATATTPAPDTPTASAGVDVEFSTKTTHSGLRATVTHVVDGDTLDVRYPNGTTDTVRLRGVDTPEVHVPTNPSEFEGVPDSDAGATCLGDAGDEASAFTTRAVAGETVQLVGIDGRGRYDRLLAFVRHDGHRLNYRLVATGHARVYDDQFEGREQFSRAETRARRNGTALWACANEPSATPPGSDDGPLAIAAIAADASGNDNANLDEETVTLENSGSTPIALDGWTVSDEADHTYSFSSEATLAAGASLTLHTGQGTDTDTDRYWGATSAVWNNDGDTVIVENASGTVVARRSYG
ncbi:lamin tail domain-containing protein [Halococcus thailandensis]|uniref:Endonuclease nuclease-like protein n=1 Tax=Halococcus thailandensis JCM 13552 TaxID=1227457 RepID=M0N4Y4_9EURY|nr:lamin tail domain-containing protein [Halococcus thailandensis]EMA52936.1 endonuclease nuclease-like protein [Halococcus thailandensis JCM 13552]